jgi:AraC-like DNA-binding protein
VETAHRILSIITSAGIVQGVFLAVAILRRRNGSRRADRFLAAILLFFTANIAVTELLFSPGKLPLGTYFLVIGGFQLLFGPLLLFYVRVLRSDIGSPALVPDFTHGPRDMAHLIPLFLYLGCLAFALAFPGALPAGLHSTLEHAGQFLWTAILAHTVSYLIAVLITVRDFTRRLKSHYSSIENLDLSWLRFITIVFIAAYSLIAVLLLALSHNHPFLPEDKTVSLALSLLVYALGWRGFFQDSKPPEPAGKSPKYARSGISPGEANRLLQALRALMDEEKPYLDPDLSLSTLAEEAGLSVGDLSRVINEAGGTSFYDFVNAYRVEEAKRLLLDARHGGRGILDIAFGVGFRSKSTFNACFKKRTGGTPKAFRLKSPAA